MTADAEPSRPALTAYIADFVASTRYGDVPADAIQLGKKSILDALACGIGGSVAAGSRLVRKYLDRLGCGKGRATVIGGSGKRPARFAALANGNSMHADDFDDSWEAATPHYQGGHPTVPVLAAVLAAAEEDGRGGREVLAAYHVGVEVLCRLIDGTDIPGGARGRHQTGTCGMVGAAAGVAHLRRLRADAVRRVLGLAAAQAAGLHQSFGTMTKPFQAGRAAEGGVVAVDLVSLGFTASSTVLEGFGGFYDSESGGCATARIEGRLGRPWAFVERAREGVRLKPWPTGSLTHPGMTKALQLIEEHDIRPDQVRRVILRTSEGTYRTLLHHRPKTGLEAKFSYEFCLAALFVDRKLGLRHFNDAFVNRPQIQRLIHAVVCERFSDAEAKASGYTPQTTFVTIELNDGRAISGRLDKGKGSLTLPMDEAEVEAKLQECAGFARWPKNKAAQVIAAVRGLEDTKDLRALMAPLSKRR